MAHSLAHALMTEVAIDCGYPASALKERLYVFPRVPGQPIQCGILIYTATAGNQGTLGGLVEVTQPLCPSSEVRAGTGTSLLRRSRLRRPRPRERGRGPNAPRRGLSRLSADFGDELRSEKRPPRPRPSLVDTVGPVGASFFK